MSKPVTQVSLTQDQLNNLPAMPHEAVKLFRDAYKSHKQLLASLHEGTRVAVKTMVGDDDKWKTLTPKSQQQVLARIFAKVREICQVDSPDGSGITANTFNTYCTIIKRAMIFHCTMEDAKRHGNYALKDALKKALDKRGGTLEQRMTKTLDECRSDPEWIGNPRISTAKPDEAIETSNPESTIMLPRLGIQNSPQHLIYLGVSSFIQWAEQPEVKEVLLSSSEPSVKIVRHLIRDLKDALPALADNNTVAEAV